MELPDQIIIIIYTILSLIDCWPAMTQWIRVGNVILVIMWIHIFKYKNFKCGYMIIRRMHKVTKTSGKLNWSIKYNMTDDKCLQGQHVANNMALCQTCFQNSVSYIENKKHQYAVCLLCCTYFIHHHLSVNVQQMWWQAAMSHSVKFNFCQSKSGKKQKYIF